MKTVNGGAVNIAILDTGIDTSHPLLRDKIKIEDCWDFVNDSINICDEVGHGTHTAYLLTKTAPRAKIFGGRVWRERTEDENTGTWVAAVCFAPTTYHLPWDLTCYRQSSAQ